MGFGSFLGGIAPLALGAVGTAFGGPVGGMLGGAVGSGISGMISAGQTQASIDAQNAFNFNVMQDQNSFSAQQAAQQMNFQKQMSDTVYQRGAADMKAAGLNPMLAAGAPDPMASGAMASAASMGSAQAVPSQAGLISSSARDTLGILQQLRESNASILNKNADTALKRGPEWLAGWKKADVLNQDEQLLMKQNDILSSEAGIVKSHPELAGWMKVLSDRGVNLSSAAGAAGALDLIP